MIKKFSVLFLLSLITASGVALYKTRPRNDLLRQHQSPISSPSRAPAIGK